MTQPNPSDQQSATAENANRAREHMANERTFLAWLRTELAIVVFGFAIGRFAIAVAAASQSGQLNSQQTEFPVFRLDHACVCIKTAKETKTVKATERTEGKYVVQSYSPLNDSNRELFRVRVGEEVGSEVVKWWNYGIADEADFNGDGVPDYSWYGGDDASQAMYLFLSSARGYRRVDVIKTLEVAWKKRFHRKAPDLAIEEEYAITGTILRRSPSGLTLVAGIKRMGTLQRKEETFTLEIEESRFAP